jgi:tetratricopeptide (TPR) repeat protein
MMRRTEAIEAKRQRVEPWTGRFKEVMDLIRGGQAQKAVDLARGWVEEEPGDILGLAALGEALEAVGDLPTAARAYGSIIDLFPARADLRRFAGARLERLERLTAAAELAADTFAKAAEQRPDHPASHRMLAFALLRLGKPEQAFAAISAGVQRSYPEGRFRGVERILREDAGLIAAAWAKAQPARRADIMAKLAAIGGTPETGPSLRFVLNWETDANDVDFHITDGKGGHAFYSQMKLPSGGELYADVTTGYGPECFTIRLPKGQRAYPYTLQAHYYSIGPMGAGMGKLEVIEHDGAGGLTFEQRPYVVMVNQAFVDLGVVKP